MLMVGEMSAGRSNVGEVSWEGSRDPDPLRSWFRNGFVCGMHRFVLLVIVWTDGYW